MLTPRPYQLEGRDFLASRHCALLADEMRVGKTPQAILAAHKAGARSMLVVCPAIAVPQWESEIHRWWPGETSPRSQVWSYDKARTLWREGLRGTVDVFIPDEAHFAKNPEAARTRMVYGKTGFASQAGAVWPLSGTPAPKHAGELWAMLRAFGAVGMTYGEFLYRYCIVDATGVVRGTDEARIPELRQILAKVMLRRTRKQVASDMPDIGFDFLHVSPRSNADVAIPPGLSDAALLEWLEANSGANADDRIEVARAKAQCLHAEILEALAGDLYPQTVVFGWHVEPLEELVAALRDSGVRAAAITGKTPPTLRALIQRQFRDKQLEVVVANILAAGTAIDLSAASHGYMLEMDWVPGNNAQAANRLISMEKAEPVTIDVVTWQGSTDDRVQRTLLTRVRQLSKLI